MTRTVLSFYCDDTHCYVAPPEAFAAFLDFVAAEGIAGESSVLLGYGCESHGLLSRPATGEQRAYVSQLERAYNCGLDAHMELMTHAGLYDFERHTVPEGAIHEGLWLHEPGVPAEAYAGYFERVIKEGERVGVRFTGLTWPGCGCETCTRRYAELRDLGVTQPNPNVYQALLSLAKHGRFRRRTVPCFIHPNEMDYGAKLVAADGPWGVYDLVANSGDWFGTWENDPARASADYYISADGASGRIVELVRAGAPYCIFYAHWQGLNPANGVGWSAFQTVVRRVQQHLQEEVVWMRPSDYTEACHVGRALA